MNGPHERPGRVDALRPAGLEATLRPEGAPELAEALRAAMPGWPLASGPATASCPAPSCEALTAWRTADGYAQAVPGRPRPRRLAGLATAAASLIADLIPRLLEARPRQSGLHCAAVEIDGRLVLFPATHRAGKSLLCAAFAAAGHRVFADDVLLLDVEDGGRAMGEALGIAPRLRRPLPAPLPADLADFIAAHDRVSDRRYGYLTLDRDRLAGHGERRPIGTIVLLDRVAGTPSPSLTRLSPGDGLLQLLGQSLAGDIDTHEPGRLVPRLLPMMQGLPCRSLRYDDPVAAVARVVEGVAEARRDEGVPSSVSPAPAFRARESAPAGGVSQAAWRRRPVAAEYPLGEEHFLVDREGGVHRLSAVAGGIWRLLGLEPLSPAEVAALLAERFPEIAPERLRADVSRLFEDLAAAGLIDRDTAG